MHHLIPTPPATHYSSTFNQQPHLVTKGFRFLGDCCLLKTLLIDLYLSPLMLLLQQLACQYPHIHHGFVRMHYANHEPIG